MIDKKRSPAEWVTFVTARKGRGDIPYEEWVAGIWNDTPGSTTASKLAVLMLELISIGDDSFYVSYNDVISLTVALDTDRPEEGSE